MMGTGILLVKRSLILVSLFVGLIGCTNQEIPPSTPIDVIASTPVPTQTEARVSQTPTLVPTKTIPSTPTVTPVPPRIPSRTMLPSITPIPGITPPPGIIYRTESSVWLMNENSEKILLLEVPSTTFVEFSSDGKRAIIEESVVNFITDSEFNLDFREDYAVCCASWWPEHPELIFVEVQPGSEWLGPGYGSLPAAINTVDETPILHVLGENPTSYGPSAISPDGITVAFDQSANPWIYDLTNGLQIFDYLSFNFPDLEEPFITHPSWSPDSNQLAWIVAGKLEGEWQNGIGLFDFRDNSSRFLYPYTVEGFDGGRSVIYWNPNQEQIAVWNHGRDLLWIFSVSGTIELSGEKHTLHYVHGSPWNASGEWLVYTTYDQELKEQVAYVISADGEENYKLGAAGFVKWSPDGKWLILSNSHWRSPGEKWLVEVDTWDMQKLDLPHDSYIFDWIEFDVNYEDS